MSNLSICVFQSESMLKVSVAGQYGHGAAGNQDAAAIISTIDSAVLANPTGALLIDLSGMNYQWGDAIAGIFQKYRTHNPSFLLAASNADAWNGILTMTLPAWTDQLGKQIQFV